LTTTLREIAMKIGVSVSTVSRVLNGHSGVSAEVRERVLKLASDLDYTPNAAARTLVL
jgi:LacI family transcriptional regulator